MIKAAVGSSDGKVVNVHFGRASQFLIFNVSREGYEFEEIRKSKPGCSNLSKPVGTMKETIELIKDCDYVLVSKIGRAMVERLKEVGIIALEMPNFIEDVLHDLSNSIEF